MRRTGRNIADYAEYSDSESPTCVDCGRSITSGYQRCKSCAAYHRLSESDNGDRMRNHRIRQFWLSAPPPPRGPISNYLADLRWQVAQAVTECRVRE